MEPATLIASPAVAVLVAGIALLAVGLIAARNDVAAARGMDRVAALTHLCFAIPLAIFGAEHLALGEALVSAVPSYMPGRIFWIYLVGLALIAASLSIATRRGVRWSGLLFGIMMVLFVAMIHLPGALRAGGRLPWTIVFRELCFGGGGWILAGAAMGASRGKALIIAGRVPVAVAALVFGVLHFLHPLGLPGVPLAREMPAWLPARPAFDYVTGALLIAAGLCFLLARKERMAAVVAGGWILLLVVVIYGPELIAGLADPGAGAQIEGLNYFADTLLFGAVILSPATATVRVGIPGAHRTPAHSTTS